MMEVITYYIFLVFYFLFIRITPYWFLYALSDVCYYVIFYIVRYRRAVVEANLKLVFPEKDAAWLKATEKEFYKHFCDLFLESLKFRHMSQKQYNKRCVWEDLHLLQEAYERKQGVSVMVGHYSNWEYISGVTSLIGHTGLAIYRPLKNKHFDGFFNRTRAQFGMIPVPMKRIFLEIIKRRKKGEVLFTGYVADQIPGDVKGKDWYNFLGQPTAVFDGADRITRKINDAVFYLKVDRVKRGYYKVKVISLFQNAAEAGENEIIKSYFRMLESHILEAPAYWLWSHRRWKRKMPEGTVVKSLN